ncbi:MAG TPA: orc1/cdc6 family replication initiation protein [Thermoplasmata archaeon]|jgi:archaeal cell division control protein 6|nr:MAG TPA: orc1/cdc6 family replication initiation protein [Thermoplasmata archaeon]
MGNIIEDELFSSSVIKDIHALDFDYVPSELPHRAEQLKKLAQMFKPLFANMAQNAFIRGPVGTGKTAMVKYFCQSLVQIARKQGKIVEYVHINCRKRSSYAMVLLGVLNHFDSRFPDRGFSVQEMLEILRTHLQRKEAQLILVLDEVDALMKKGGSTLIYDLTRFNDETLKTGNPVSVIMISQKDIFADLEEAALSTFKRSNIVVLEKYIRDELYDIVRQRVSLAFHTNTVLGESIDLIADIASEFGDARFSIELLWKAGMYADEKHAKQVVPEHVRAAKAETYSVVTETKLKNLGRHQLLALLSIAKRLQKEGAAYANTGEVEKTYAITCEEYHEDARAHTMFWNYLKEIEQAGFIRVKPSGKGQVGASQFISLPDIPAEVLRGKLEELLA